MNQARMIAMVKKFTKQSGVMVTWEEMSQGVNSRGEPIDEPSAITKNAKILLLKEDFNPLKDFIPPYTGGQGITGLAHDYKNYIIFSPEIDLKKDTIITDNHAIKWKVGTVDWMDVNDVPVVKQAKITEVQ
jgi:hypothetical protein